MQKKIKMWGVLLLLVANTLLIGGLIHYNYNDYELYYQDTYVGSKYINIIEIDSVEDFFAFSSTVGHSNSYRESLVVLNTDLDFSGYKDFPVVGLIEDGEDAAFEGTFEGNGHVISGVFFEGDEVAGIFAKLAGIVKNLRIEKSFFKGELCGAVAAQNSGGAILNCYVDATVLGKISGTVAGKNISGVIENCVVNDAIVGESIKALENNCFLIGEENVVLLNDNLINLSGQYNDTLFYQWVKKEDCILSDKKCNLLDSMSTKIKVSGQEVVLKGYYSESDRQWCFALPSGYEDKKLVIEATTTEGDSVTFTRDKEENISFVLDDKQYDVKFLSSKTAETLYLILDQNKSLDYVNLNKREEIPGRMLIFDNNGKVSYKPFAGFYGHGNSSWEAEKKSYNLKFDSYENLLEMGANDGFALLAGYRMNSLMSYAISHELSKEIGFPYVPEYRFVNLYVAGEYAGVYCLCEKIEIDTNRLEISSVYNEMKNMIPQELETFEHQVWKGEETEERRHYYNIETNPKDITGGYLLEMDFFDYAEEESRFTTKNQYNKIVLKRAVYSSEAQVNYIANFWQEFEDALFAETGYNENGKHYSEYIDVESFAMQWLMYELSKEDSMQSSIYYYKESDVSGDGLLHACCPWDMERSYSSLDVPEVFGSVSSVSDYWAAFYKHQDFREELATVWFEKMVPAIELMVMEKSSEKISHMKNISWYEAFVLETGKLENSRWSEADMLGKCDLIRKILNEREKVLSEELLNYLKTK